MKANSYLCAISVLLLLGRLNSNADCGQLTGTITNLPAIPNVNYQVTGLNATGQVAGYFSVAFEHGPHAFLYNIGNLTDIGTLGGDTSYGYAINNAGNVVGQADLTGNAETDAFQYNGVTNVDLGTLGGTNSNALAINDAGQVAGNSLPPTGFSTIAFLYTNGPIVPLGDLGGGYSSAAVINNATMVAGESSDTNGNTHGFVWSAGIMTDVGTLGGSYSTVYALNDAGLAAGVTTVPDGTMRGFTYAGGTMSNIGTLGGSLSVAFGVNQAGQVIGDSTTTNDAEYHAVLYAGGTLTDLGTLGGNFSFADAINNLGQVVGQSGTTNGASHAFLWQNGQMIDLNTVLPADSGWELNEGLFINDAGRVVGVGTLGGISQWFVMDLSPANKTPVAVAGPDQTVDCQAQVKLDGTGSSDADNDTLTYQWTLLGTVLGTNATLSVSLPLGTNVVTLTVADPCGASSQTNVTVVVTDTTPPTVSCPGAITNSADANCQATIPSIIHQVMATDNCTASASLVVTQSPAAGTVVGCGQFPITVTVTDLAGNTNTCSTLFVVVDTTAPVITSTPMPVTVSADANGQAAVPNVLIGVMATDNCTPANQLILSQDPAAGTTVGIGQYKVKVAVKDASGNCAVSNVTFTVVDTTPPVIVSVPGPITVSADTNCQAVVPSVLDGVVATDNCTPANQLVINQSPTAGAVVGSGQYSIQVMVQDASGNTTMTNVSFNVVDTTAPTIVSLPGPITLTADANCQAQVPNILSQVVATDNCTPANQLVLAQDPAAGTTVGSGQYTIKVTVKDAAGNCAKGNVALTVGGGTTPPTIASVTVNPSVLSPPNHALIPVTVSVTASDSCDPAPVSKIISITANGTTAPGDIQITGNLTATLAASKNNGSTRVYTITVQCTDASGNSSLGTTYVNVPTGNGSGTVTGTSNKATK